MKYYAEFNEAEDFYVKADIIAKSPSSGFVFSVGTMSSNTFTTGVTVSGISGMLFDQSGRFFGGFYSGRQFDLEFHFFPERSSLFHKNSIICNNYPISNLLNCVEFDKHENSSAAVNVYYGSVYSSEYLIDSLGQTLFSFDGFALSPSL